MKNAGTEVTTANNPLTPQMLKDALAELKKQVKPCRKRLFFAFPWWEKYELVDVIGWNSDGVVLKLRLKDPSDDCK